MAAGRRFCPAAIYDGASRTERRRLAVTLQSFATGGEVQRAGPDGLIDRKRRQQRGSTRRIARRSRRSSRAADPCGSRVVRWRIVDLRQWIFEEFRVVVAEQTLSRVLRKMAIASGSPPPLRPGRGAIEDFKKAFPRAWRDRREKASSPPLVWFADERASARRTRSRDVGQRARAPARASANRLAYIFGAICPSKQSARSSCRVATPSDDCISPRSPRKLRRTPRRRPRDQAGWHLSAAECPLQHHAHPATRQSPELNPQKTSAVHPRQLLSNLIFKSYDDIVDHCAAMNSSSISPESVHRRAIGYQF